MIETSTNVFSRLSFSIYYATESNKQVPPLIVYFVGSYVTKAKLRNVQHIYNKNRYKNIRTRQNILKRPYAFNVHMGLLPYPICTQHVPHEERSENQCFLDSFARSFDDSIIHLLNYSVYLFSLLFVHLSNLVFSCLQLDAQMSSYLAGFINDACLF